MRFLKNATLPRSIPRRSKLDFIRRCALSSILDIFTREIRMLDETDSRLLAAVQAQAQITAQELGDLLKLSASQAARRRAKLEADGLITGYSARLSPSKLGLTVQAFVQVQMAAHSPEAAKGFLRLIATLPEVTACWTLTGEADYLLRVWCADLPALNTLIHNRLLPNPAVARVQSQIVMDQPKPDAGLPV
jgi:DNA-binding Lrp family transcriptional regulator